MNVCMYSAGMRSKHWQPDEDDWTASQVEGEQEWQGRNVWMWQGRPFYTGGWCDRIERVKGGEWLTREVKNDDDALLWWILKVYTVGAITLSILLLYSIQSILVVRLHSGFSECGEKCLFRSVTYLISIFLSSGIIVHKFMDHILYHLYYDAVQTCSLQKIIR